MNLNISSAKVIVNKLARGVLDIVDSSSRPPGYRLEKCVSTRTSKRREKEVVFTFVKSLKQSKKPFGSSTCSITSIEQTISNCLPSLTKSSAGICLYSNWFWFVVVVDLDEGEIIGVWLEDWIKFEAVEGNDGSRAAWAWATTIFIGAASIANVLAPNRDNA